VFPCALGTFSVKRECFLVLWARLVSKERVFPCTLGTFSVKERVYGCSGTIRTILGTKKGVFTSAWTTNWMGNIGVWNRQYTQDRAYDIYDY
jgi:hypothetical protein